MAIERLFSGQTPSSVDVNEGTPIEVATSVVFGVTGEVIGIEFYTPDTLDSSYTVQLYEVTDDDGTDSGAGTLLAEAVKNSGLSAGAWVDCFFDPVLIVASTKVYRCGLFCGNGHYVATSSFFTSPLVNGNVTGVQSGSDPVGLGSIRNGTYIENATPAYPTQSFSAACYFVGPIFRNPPGGFNPAQSSALLTF